MWTQFWDMHSGGGKKEKWDKIYIEAPLEEAKLIFYNRFGHNPDRVTCTCCGNDYSVDESKTLEQATGYHRYQTLDEYLKKENVIAIRAEEIKPEERRGELPEQGYVWRD